MKQADHSQLLCDFRSAMLPIVKSDLPYFNVNVEQLQKKFYEYLLAQQDRGIKLGEWTRNARQARWGRALPFRQESIGGQKNGKELPSFYLKY